MCLSSPLPAAGAPSHGNELCGKTDTSMCLYQAEETPAPLHLAFTAETREQVDAFYRASLGHLRRNGRLRKAALGIDIARTGARAARVARA